MPLSYLSNTNEGYIQNQSLGVAFNLYIAKLSEMNSYSNLSMRGNLSIQSLTPNTSNAYRPSQYEQTLYFIQANGNGNLRQYSLKAC